MPATGPRIGVSPAAEHARRARLWSALEEAHAVSFEARPDGALGELDAAIAFGADAGAALAAAGLPGLVVHGAETKADLATATLSNSLALDRPLRGARLTEAHAVALPSGSAEAQGEVLAMLDGRPAWTLTGKPEAPLHHVGCAPAELAQDEALRQRLQPGRCLALLALVQFLRHLLAHTDIPPAHEDDGRGAVADPDGVDRRGPAHGRPAETPLQAAFVIDDPNLHRPRYGHLRYEELLRDARAHGYHLSIAMVPLDAWFADPRLARMFRDGADHLSISIHGNTHEGPELSRPDSLEAGISLASHALRRMAAFERRTGVTVDRVMVPPHEQISEPMARALVACGFAGLCTTRPYPWLAKTPQAPWLTRPPEAGPLAGWRPADVVAGGLPVLLRADFALHPREDLVLRAFLGQPLILYGHHELLRGGPADLAAAAAEIDGLGEVRWGSLGQIARGLPGAAAAEAAPAGAATSVARRATGHEPNGDTAHGPNGDTVPARGAMSPAQLAAIPSPPRRLRPVARRVAAESEVRLRALLAQE
ncbi:MAG TPA: hypothetical protein VMU32_11205 [Solirubrobacteraceae bacterium]|nr:hypothetical protein [Solirubrobacteraceae bacterium]